MKKTAALFCLIFFISTSALAVVNPDPDIMGMYWDLDADTYCIPPVAGAVNMYIVLTNSTMDAIRGFEFGFSMEASVVPYLLSASLADTQADNVASGFQNFIVGYGAPRPCTQANLLVTLSIGNFAGVPVDFYLHQATPASIEGNLPVILRTDDSLIQVITPWPGEITARQSIECDPSPTDHASWDCVKSLYR